MEKTLEEQLVNMVARSYTKGVLMGVGIGLAAIYGPKIVKQFRHGWNEEKERYENETIETEEN